MKKVIDRKLREGLMYEIEYFDYVEREPPNGNYHHVISHHEIDVDIRMIKKGRNYYKWRFVLSHFDKKADDGSFDEIIKADITTIIKKDKNDIR
jgi:hypothetical protein